MTKTKWIVLTCFTVRDTVDVSDSKTRNMLNYADSLQTTTTTIDCEMKEGLFDSFCLDSLYPLFL